MDLLKKQLAPITDLAWEEISDQAKEVFNSDLSVRKFADVEGPKGLDLGAVPTGKLDIPEKQNTKEILYGIQEVQPLIEVRSSFELDLWELDNISRGAKDIDLDPLVKAAKRIASFEEKTIFNGLKNARIKGLKTLTEHEHMSFPNDASEVLSIVASAVTELNNVSVEGPYSLVVDTHKWKMISSYTNGYPLQRKLKEILGGSIILAPHLEGAFVVSLRGGDFKITLGQDISIGYETHTRKSVLLYFSEAFTFQTIGPDAIVYLK